MHARNIRRDVNFPRKKEKRAETGAKSKSSRCAFVLAATKPPCIDPATPTQTPTPHHGWPPPSPKNFPTRCIVASLSYSPHSSATVSRPTLFRSTQIRSTAGEEGILLSLSPPSIVTRLRIFVLNDRWARRNNEQERHNKAVSLLSALSDPRWWTR